VSAKLFNYLISIKKLKKLWKENGYPNK
jgi:hypothetical protein